MPSVITLYQSSTNTERELYFDLYCIYSWLTTNTRALHNYHVNYEDSDQANLQALYNYRTLQVAWLQMQNELEV